MAHRPPNTRGGSSGRQSSMARNPAQFQQLFPPPRGGTAAPLIPNIPPQPIFPSQMATAPNRQRAPLLSAVPNQPFVHPSIFSHAQLQKMHQQIPAALTASYLQSVPSPASMSHMRGANVPQVTSPIIHPPGGYHPTGMHSFQPAAINQQPPPFVNAGQAQPPVQYTKPAQPLYPQTAANHQGPPQTSLVKKPSKAIKIVNPDTGMEVDTNASTSTASLDRASSSASSSTVEIDPSAENRKKEFMEKVTSTVGKPLTNGASSYRVAGGPNAIISSPQMAANLGSINLQADTSLDKHTPLPDPGKSPNAISTTSLMSSHANAKEFTPSASYSSIPAAVPQTQSTTDETISEAVEKTTQLDVPPEAEKTVETVADTAAPAKVGSTVQPEDETPVQPVSEPSTLSDEKPQTEPTTPEVQEDTKVVVESEVESAAGVPPVEPATQPEPVIPCATPSLSSNSSGSITNEDRPSAVAAIDSEKPPAPVAPVVAEQEEELAANPVPKPVENPGQDEPHPPVSIPAPEQAHEIEPESSSSASEAGPSEPPPPPTATGLVVADVQDLPLLKPVPGERQLKKSPQALVKEVKAIVPKEEEMDKKAESVPERTMSERAVRDRTREERGGKKSPMSERPTTVRKEFDRTQKQTKQEARETPEPVASVPGIQKTDKLVGESVVVEKRRQDKSPVEGQTEKKPLLNGEATDKERRQAYDREFLLQFRKKLLEPPPNLLSSEVYRTPTRDGPDMFAPFSSGMSRKGRNQSRGTSKVIAVPREEVHLNKAENRWVRPSERQRELSEDEKETIEVFRKFQGILNKLTPQKFKDLAEQALALKINSDERLRGCIDKIFKKALEEPNFSVAYANLCRVMSQTKVEVVKMEDGKETQGHTTFRRELLTKCQREFEKDKKDDEERDKMLAAINAAETAEEKQAKKSALDVWHTKARSRSLGNIRFIGELFKLKMLSEGIMHECIFRLLRSGSDEESLECFCRLITTTGKELDHEQAKVRLDQYFDRIDDIRKKKKVSSRIRFMLQDIMDLRKNDWVPRRQESLKTIDQIHYEAQLEKEKEKEMLRHVPPKGGRGRDMPDKGRALKPQGGPDEWRTKESVARREMKPDINRIQGILKRDRGKETTAGFRPQRWGSKPQGPATPLLEVKGDRQPGKTPIRMGPPGVASKRPIPPPATSRGPFRAASVPDPSKERKAAIKLVAQMSNQSSAEPSVPSAIDESLMERKTLCIIQELEQTRDFREAVECVQEMNCPDLLPLFVNQAMELTSNARKMVGQLFQLLIDEGVLSTDRFQAGCVEVLGFAEDLEVDIPKFWDYLAEIWSPVVYANHLSLATLAQMVRDAGMGHKAALSVIKMLSIGLSMFGKQKTVDLFMQSLLTPRDLGDDEDEIKELFDRNGLDFLLKQGASGSMVKQAASGSIEDLPYLKDLSILFRTLDQPHDEILTWIEKNCSLQERHTPKFIHCLTQAAVGAATNGESGASCRFSEEIFKKRLTLLKVHVDEDESLQLELLYASQVAVTKLKHPPGLLYQIFSSLYDVEVVSETVFRMWKERGSEEYGRGVALQAASPFFEWLGSTECESDAET